MNRWGVPLIGAAAASSALMAYAVREPSCSWLAPSVYQGASDRPAIALTFDDGPSESTGYILEVLARYRAPATFFQCGANVRRLPRGVREVVDGGHEIGNHSDTHTPFYFKTHRFIYREMASTQESIFDCCGIRPRYFRAPFGVRWFGLREAQARLGLLGVTWTTIGLDWKSPEENILSRLIKGARSGAIFCLHDGRMLMPDPDLGATIAALHQLLPRLIDQGFHFEKVSEILCPTT